MVYILSYDIVEDRRRAKVAKLMESHGERVQRSVYECRIEPKRLDSLLLRVLKHLDLDTDSLIVYSLCGSCAGTIDRHGIGGDPGATAGHIV